MGLKKGVSWCSRPRQLWECCEASAGDGVASIVGHSGHSGNPAIPRPLTTAGPTACSEAGTAGGYSSTSWYRARQAVSYATRMRRDLGKNCKQAVVCQ